MTQDTRLPVVVGVGDSEASLRAVRFAADEAGRRRETLAGWREKEPDVAIREVVVRDRPARALLAAGMTAQLIVVGHRRRLALGSTTHAVLHRAASPVAVVPLAGATR